MCSNTDRISEPTTLITAKRNQGKYGQVHAVFQITKTDKIQWILRISEKRSYWLNISENKLKLMEMFKRSLDSEN